MTVRAGEGQPAGLSARREALRILGHVLEGRRPPDPPTERELSAPDRARAARLADETLRRIEPADRVLTSHMRRPPLSAVMNVLRLALVEMALGAAPHGVVNAAVEITRMNRRTAFSAGLVNAVLRKVTPGMLTLEPPQHLPPWLRAPVERAWGAQVAAAIERAHSVAPPLDLTLREGGGAVIAPDGRHLPTGSLRLDSPGQVSALAGHDDGGWWVQDAAAALPARLLGAQRGKRVLDLCAAPGGKTLQLAAAGARVVALDQSELRLGRLRENLARTRLQAEVVAADALEWQPDEPFDAILLDAPCSASGTIRRHPDLPFLRREAELAPLVALQGRLLDRAIGWLRPGGRLVFATCSLLPAEGEEQLDAILRRYPAMQAERVAIAGVDPDWWTPANGLRLRPDYWPDKGGMDGFFCARLRAPG